MGDDVLVPGRSGFEYEGGSLVGTRSLNLSFRVEETEVNPGETFRSRPRGSSVVLFRVMDGRRDRWIRTEGVRMCT